MSEKKKERELRYLSPIEELPPKWVRSGLYDDILNEFMESGLKCAEIKDLGKNPATVVYSLKRKIKDKRIQNVVVRQRSKKIYLQRLE